jgi:methionine synthase I (cobalamin-dependent)/5,10-methylenetetrahydrofolate reductase
LTRPDLRKILENGTPLLFDGAMGTELYNKGLFINRCFEEANLSNPSLVLEIHQSYVRAGAQVLSTNSWGASRFKLTGHNLQDRVRDINRKAAELARSAARDEVWVAGSVGPLGVRLEPWGPTSFEEARLAFEEQIRGLVDGGVDLLSLETFSDITEIQQAILAARSVAPNIPVFAHMVINPDGNTPMGTPLEWTIRKLDEWKVDAVGLNCSVGPQPMMTAIARIRKATDLPISLQPNAGLPKVIDGRSIYMSTPEYMAEFAKNFLQAGVQFVGGCCGTTAEHTRAMANSMRHGRAMQHPQTVPATPRDSSEPEVKEAPRVPALQKSLWAAKIARGERVYSVELLPPASVRPRKIIEQSKQLKASGIDAVNIPDGPRASARMSAILTAVMIEQRAKIETVLHYTCRDRNLLGMQSDMLGAHAIGLRNMLLVTGDPPKMGSYPNATGVFDIDAIGLTNMVHRLNGGIDLGGRSIGEPTALSIGVGVNPVHRDFEYEMKRFRWKVEAGAEWAITQPVFDVASLHRFLEFIEKANIRIPIIAGVWPLLSHRNAVFMNNEVPGVVIPEAIIKRMEVPKSPDDAKKVGIDIAREMVEELGNDVQGIQMSAPFGKIELALAIIGREVVAQDS